MFASHRILKVRSVTAFAPLLLLVAAALFVNVGGAVAPDATAASVTVTASVTADKHLAASICTGGTAGETAGATGTLAFGGMSANTANTKSCAIGFGSTNSGSVNMVVSAASATFGWAGFSPQGVCATPVNTAAAIGIDSAVSAAAAGGTTTAPTTVNCATAGQYQSIATSPATACTVTGQTADATCTLGLSVTTGTAPANASLTGTLTVNAT